MKKSKKKTIKSETSLSLFDFLNNISYDKKDLSDSEEFQKIYSDFMINRFLSMSPETVFWAHELSKMNNIPKKSHYYFLLNGLEKKKRYFKYEKGSKSDERINKLQEFYNVNIDQALEIFELLSEEQINKIMSLFEVSIERMKS